MLLTSLLGILLSGAAAVVFAAIAVGLAVRGEPSLDLPSWTMVGLLSIAGVLSLPAYHAGRRLLGRPPGLVSRASSRWALPLVAYPLFLVAGYLAVNRGVAPALLGSIGLLGTSALPVILVIGMLRSLGPPLSALRASGQFAVGITWMPAAALAAEVALVVPLLIGLAVWMTSTVEGAALLSVMNELSPSDPDAALELLGPAIQAPGIVLGMYGYIGLIVPAVEEAVKTMAVWPFVRRRISAAEAFLGGALGGAGYALFEALFLTQPGEAWLVSTVARAGATLLHVFTAGLTSWGLVTAVRARRPLILIGAYAALGRDARRVELVGPDARLGFCPGGRRHAWPRFSRGEPVDAGRSHPGLFGGPVGSMGAAGSVSPRRTLLVLPLEAGAPAPPDVVVQGVDETAPKARATRISNGRRMGRIRGTAAAITIGTELEPP